MQIYIKYTCGHTRLFWCDNDSNDLGESKKVHLIDEDACKDCLNRIIFELKSTIVDALAIAQEREKES